MAEKNKDNEVYAPYHFVPLSKWIYMPKWAHLVSHDFPFEDGYSGMLEYSLTNHTPLCVGSEKNEDKYLQFARNPLDELIIPGSSLKGMIRNVLEIASFGKFSHTDDQHLSYRDISSDSAYLKKIGKKVQSGWIKYNECQKHWEFFHCDSAKIKHSAEKDKNGDNIDEHNALNKFIDKEIHNSDFAVQKYLKAPLSKPLYAKISEPRGKAKNRWAEFLSKEAQENLQEGYCVFTNKRIFDANQGHKPEDFEFSYFFYNRRPEVKADNINQQVANLFASHQSVITIKDENGKKIDGNLVAYLQKNNHNEYGIPVFALIENGKVDSFGFAKMPRLSYKNSTLDLLKHHNSLHVDDAIFDMAELMFGCLKPKGLGLKSRVIFSDANLGKRIDQLEKGALYKAKPTVLAEPKPSFLGAYLEQNGTGESYQSYDDHEAKLAGWKRYGIQQEYKHHEPPNRNESAQSKFELLTENHNFKGKIVFQNLKKDELAALIWTLTLGNDTALRHGLGHAKPLGAGAVSIEINRIKLKPNNPVNTSKVENQNDEYLSKNTNTLVHILCNDFEKHMEEQYQRIGKWLYSPQIRYLKALSDPNNDDADDEDGNKYQYPTLEEFKRFKGSNTNKKANDNQQLKKSLPELSHQGKRLTRKLDEKNALLSPSFSKGRLSALFDSENQIHKTAQEEADQYQVLVAEREAKAAAIKKLQNLAEQPPFERMLGTLENLLENQEAISKSKTEKKQAEKDINSFAKEAKELPLTKEQAKQLTIILKQFTFAIKFTEKFIKHLDSI